MNFKATRLALLSLFVLSLTFSSCDPLRPILMILEGDWDVTSFTEDGVEVMGTVFTSIQIDLKNMERQKVRLIGLSWAPMVLLRL